MPTAAAGGSTSSQFWPHARRLVRRSYAGGDHAFVREGSWRSRTTRRLHTVPGDVL